MAPTVVIVTGIAGTGVRSSLERLVRSSGGRGDFFSIDELLWMSFCSDARRDPKILLETDLSEGEIAEGNRPNWWKLLKLPIDRIRHYWHRAAVEVLQRLGQSKAEFCLVNLHACYQGDDYRWRLSPVAPSSLLAMKPSSFFTMVDDVYDIHSRRVDEVETVRSVCYDLKRRKWQCLAKLLRESVGRLSDLLLWRQEEIMFTDVFASVCGVPSHVFPVKHPASTLWKLIEEPGRSYYFSHPITGLRARDGFPDLPEMKELADVAKVTRARLPLLEPTAIDEYRFRTLRSASGEIRWLPLLGQRWPLLAPEGELVWMPPQLRRPHEGDAVCARENVDALEVQVELEQVNRGEGPAKVKESIFGAIGRLESAINADITWRDHHLVDQSRRLIVYRPYYKGRPSGGVRREVDYFVRLTRLGAETYPSVVYHPDPDEEDLGNEVALDLVRQWKLNPGLAESLRGAGDQTERELARIVADMVKFQPPSETLADELVKSLQQLLRLEPGVADPVPMGAGANTARQKSLKAMRQTADSIARNRLEELKYLSMLLLGDGIPLEVKTSRHDFLEWIERQAQPIPRTTGDRRRGRRE